MNIERAVLALGFQSPDPVHDDGTGQHHAPVFAEQAQEGEFLVGQGDGFSVYADLVPVRADVQRADLVFRGGGRRVRAAEERADAGGEYRYSMPLEAAEPSRSKYMAILTGAAISTDVAMNTVVLKCHAGTAQAACVAIDQLGLSDVAGTLAGDDTIFILCYTVEAAAALKSRLDAIFGF